MPDDEGAVHLLRRRSAPCRPGSPQPGPNPCRDARAGWTLGPSAHPALGAAMSGTVHGNRPAGRAGAQDDAEGDLPAAADRIDARLRAGCGSN
jgi:hypothetical protein